MSPRPFRRRPSPRRRPAPTQPREGIGEDLGECAMQTGDMRLIVSAHDQAGSARGGSRCAHDSRVAHGPPVAVQDQGRLPLG